MHFIEFRPATRDDLAVIVALLADDELGRSREVVDESSSVLYERAFDAIAADPNQLLLVAELEGVVVGSLQITYIPGLTRRGMWRGQIEGVRVASGRRNSGVGRAMVEHAVGLCRNRGCGLVQLTTDKARPDALRFYQSLGFIASHEGLKLTIS